jgi:putative flippase GtrA
MHFVRGRSTARIKAGWSRQVLKIQYHAVVTKLRDNRLLRFFVAGAINTIFGFSIYALFILIRIPVPAALLAGTFAAVAFNFALTGGSVFRDLSIGRFPAFAASYGFLYFINLELIDMLSPWAGDPILAQAILILPMALLSYFTLSQVVFGAKPKAGNRG